MAQNTNLNVSPYYDDFDKFKNFYRVLFRPGFPIQARELTTLQSILQNQVESVGNHLFKDGSMVIPGQVAWDNNADSVLIQSSFLGSQVENYRKELVGKTITGVTSGVRAEVIKTLSSDESEKGFITLYVKYKEAGGSDRTVTKLLNNEQIVVDSEITYGSNLIEIGTPVAQLIPNEANQTGSIAYVNTGVYFIRGFFVDVPYQSIILDQYQVDPSYRIGLEVSESIITSEDDTSLNDNAAGTSNYAAPGAHRFRIRATLVKKTFDDDADKNFYELMRLKNGKVELQVDETGYNELEKRFASQIYDLAGDFMIKPFDIKLRESLNDGFNNGVYLPGQRTDDTGVITSDNLYAVQVSPGKVYLKGYLINKQSQTFLDLPKPRTFETVENNIIPFELGNVIKVTNVFGTPVISGPDIDDSYQIIELRDDFTSTPGNSAGNIVGLARVASWEFSSSGDALEGDLNDIYNCTAFDVSFITKIYLTQSTTIEGGSRIRGKTSGANGFIRLSSGTSFTGQTVSLYGVTGTFRVGEVIEVDGRDKGTIQGVYSYQFSDIKQVVGRDNLNNVIFTGDVSLTDSFRLGGDFFTYDSGVLTGYNSNISPEVRSGDLLYVSESEYFRVDALASNFSLSSVFNYADQSINVTPSPGFTPTNGTQYNTVIRLRPFLFGKEDGDLFTEMPKTAIRSISDESMIVKRTYESQITSNSFTIALAANEQFQAVETENYNLVVTSVSGGSSYSVGDVVILQNDNPSGAAYTTFNTTGTPRSTITVANLVGITTIRFNAAISKNIVVEKVKNANKMRIWKVNKTLRQSDQIQYGLAYSNIYGTRIEDVDISLGVTDVYKLRAVYESVDNNDAVVPYVTLVEPTFFATGSLVTGQTSGAKGYVVDFNTGTLRLTIVYEGSVPFQQNETITGFDSNGNALQSLLSDADGSINLGSKNITSSFYLESGQKNFFYDVSRIVRKKGVASPIRKVKIVADYFSHESSGDYFNIDSYVGVEYAEIPTFVSAVGSGTNTTSTQKALRDVLDFRPGVSALADGTGTLSDPFALNCSSFDFASRVFKDSEDSTTFDIPKPDSDFRCDYTFYLPRIDKLFVNTTGEFLLTLGKPAEVPQPPSNIDGAMLLATIAHNAYGFNVDTDNYIFKENIRRYTMKDIAGLDARLQNVEYYSVLTLLESDTESLTITDEFGNDKFKNGFFVDSFENQNVAEITNPDYGASIDFAERILRPSHYTTNVPLTWNTSASSNVRESRRIVTLPFEHQLLIQQPYASKTENVNPFNVFTFLGAITLSPASDDWVSVRRLPTQVTNIEGNFSALVVSLGERTAEQGGGFDFENGFGPLQWSSWTQDWTGAVTTTSDGRPQGWNASGGGIAVWGTRTITTTGIVERRTGTQQRVRPTFRTESLGDRVVSRSNVPWIRSRNIGITAEALKPSTRFYAFFDNVDATSYCFPKLIEVIKDSTENSNSNNIPFQVGEVVQIIETSSTGTNTIIFRAEVARLNDGYRYDPYASSGATLTGELTELSDVYSSNTPYLNIDVTTLSGLEDAEYYGNIQINYVVEGLSSGARAVIRDRRLITDPSGNFKGIFFIPDENVDSNPRWATGRRIFKLTTSSTNETLSIGDTTSSSGQVEYAATGILQEEQEQQLSIRDGVIEDVVIPSESQNVPARTTTESTIVGWYDPLAQSFIVQERGGCYISKVDVYFATKDERIPVRCEIRRMESGIPTKFIQPNSQIVLQPEEVEISENASIPTSFIFDCPVYVSDLEEYCVVLLSDSNKYTVWISEFGEVDITGDRTISEQPYAGVLFKSQNGSTWTPNQLQDLKFEIYRAEFGPLNGTLVLNNASLGLQNGGVRILRENPIQTKQATQTLVLNDNTGSFTVGARIYQQTTNASATIQQFIESTNPHQLVIENVDGTFLQGSNIGGLISYPIISSQTTGSIRVDSPTGSYTIGSTVTGGTSGATAIVTGWSLDGGGTYGTLSVNYVSKDFDDGETISQTNPSISGTVDETNTTYSGDTYQKYLSLSPTYSALSKRVTVFHRNHGMHDPTNTVEIRDVVSEVSPTTLRASISNTDLSITVSDALAFHTVINGLPISESNPGYMKINGEIISYTAIGNDGTVITIPSSGRGLDGTVAAAHQEGSFVECYNLDGIPLTEINKVHEGVYNVSLDTYDLQCESVSTSGIVAGGSQVRATQNIPFEYIHPQVQKVEHASTPILARINTVSGTSINNGNTTEASFVNSGEYIEVDLNQTNYLSGQKLILSGRNEQEKLAGQKSFTMQLLMSSSTSLLTPIVDLDRCSIITTSSRINNPDNWQLSEQFIGDPHDAVYITRMVSLDNQVSRSIHVYFDAYRPPESDFKVLYRIVPPGFSGDENTISWEFFNETGGPDALVTPSNRVQFKSYVYSVSGIEFSKYQIKIVMTSTNQAYVPQIKYFRAIATAI